MAGKGMTRSPVGRIEEAWRRQCDASTDNPELELARLWSASQGNVRVSDKDSSGIIYDPARRYPAACSSLRSERPNNEVLLTYATFNSGTVLCTNKDGELVDTIAILSYEAQVLRRSAREDLKRGTAKCDLVGLADENKVLIAIEGKAVHGRGTDLGYAIVEAWTYCRILQLLATEQQDALVKQIRTAMQKHHDGKLGDKALRQLPGSYADHNIKYAVLAPRSYFADQLARPDVVARAASFLQNRSDAFYGFLLFDAKNVKDLVEATDPSVERFQPRLKADANTVTRCGGWGDLIRHLVSEK